MNMEVLAPMSTQWLSKCGPSKYAYEGYPEQPIRSILGSSSCSVENVSWRQLTEREPFKNHKPRQDNVVPRVITPGSKASSIQDAGKSLLGRVQSTASLERGLKESDSVQWYCDTFEDASLIPGLPEDVAKTCLALMPREDFPSLRKVSRAWWNYIQTREFYDTRKLVGTLEEWMYTLTLAPDGMSTQWQARDPKKNGDWKVLPPMPGVRVGPGTCVVNEKLVVLGGLVLDGEGHVSSDVYIYSPVIDQWKKGASMKYPRYEFACGVLDGKVYVIGGRGGPNLEAIDSMEVYDPEKDDWTCSTPLSKPRWGCFAAGVEGKLYVLGGHARFTLGSPRFMDVFDPKTRKWIAVKNASEMVQSHAVLNGKIYCVQWKDERSLKCYDIAENTWSKVVIPLSTKCSEGYCFGSYGGKIYFFPKGGNPANRTLVYDPEALKGSEWQSSSITVGGPCLSCLKATA